MAIKACEIAKVFESIAPLSLGHTGDELGFVYGEPETPITGVACMWNAQTQSIGQAAALGCNMLVVHEGLFFAPQPSPWYQGPAKPEDIEPNRRRRDLLDAHGMVVYRSHSNYDALPVEGVPDQAVAALGLKDLSVVAAQKYFKVHACPPMSVASLAHAATVGLDMPWPARVFGDAMRPIERFAFLIGGFGGNQFNMPQAVRDMGGQCLIIGEMLEWIVIQALELDMPVIETLHSLSETPALRRQAALLAERLPVPVHFVPSGVTAWPSRC